MTTKPTHDADWVARVLDDVREEVQRAEAKFPPFNSAHEGYAVILEELDELWEEVKRNGSVRDTERMRLEAIQVAAMAVRFLVNVCRPSPEAADAVREDPR